MTPEKIESAFDKMQPGKTIQLNNGQSSDIEVSENL